MGTLLLLFSAGGPSPFGGFLPTVFLNATPTHPSNLKHSSLRLKKH